MISSKAAKQEVSSHLSNALMYQNKLLCHLTTSGAAISKTTFWLITVDVIALKNVEYSGTPQGQDMATCQPYWILSKSLSHTFNAINVNGLQEPADMKFTNHCFLKVTVRLVYFERIFSGAFETTWNL